MSLLYAEKLSFRADVGAVGMPEFFETPTVLQSKAVELANLIKQSKHLVVFTGAGISTSCGIPDFRGPNGVWTLQHEGKPMPTAGTPFHQARPGVTHMALVELQRAGILKYIISQNIDGLHLRSGIPRGQLAELHGNCFREVCGGCGKDYVRDFEVETIGLQPTGRRCSVSACSSKLHDTIVDWEDVLPPSELKLAEKHSKQADLILCLGTRFDDIFPDVWRRACFMAKNLQITPACNLPMKTVRAGGKLVIVNLQATPKDKNAALLIHARVDEVILEVMKQLDLQIPPYVRVDCLTVSYYYSLTKKKSIRWVLRIASTHGQKAPLPFLESVEITFPERPDLKSASWTKQPFLLRRVTSKVKTLDILVRLEFGHGSMCSSAKIPHTLQFEPMVENGVDRQCEDSVETLRSSAVEHPLCGNVKSIGIRQHTDGTKGAAFDFGIVTSVISHTQSIVTSLISHTQNGTVTSAVSHTPNGTKQSPLRQLHSKQDEKSEEGHESEDRHKPEDEKSEEGNDSEDEKSDDEKSEEENGSENESEPGSGNKKPRLV